MTIGERIKAVRDKAGISQVELADKIDVSKQTLYKYENNIITNIPSNKIEAIATITHVSPAFIMGWTDSTETNSMKNIFPIELKRFPMLGEIACGEPRYADEDRENYVLAGADGEIAAVIVNNDNEATLKRLFYYRDQALLVLRPENPAYEEQRYSGEQLNEVHILGKAIAFQSDVR